MNCPGRAFSGACSALSGKGASESVLCLDRGTAASPRYRDMFW